MEKVICEKIPRIIKNQQKLEKKLGVKIKTRGKEVILEGQPEDEYIAEKIIEALEFGFPFSIVLLIKEQDYLFEVINIKDYTKRKDLSTIRARIIGKKGKTLRALTELTKCFFEIKDNRVGIIGDPEYIQTAQTAVIMLIQGSKQANAYRFLEQHQIKPIIDLGLKKLKE